MRADDIDLLRLEMATLWERDAYGRLGPHPLVALAIADDGQAVRFGPDVPDDVRRALEHDLGVEPARLERTRERLSFLGSTRWSAGRSYVFSAEPPALASQLEVLTSDGAVSTDLARPEPWWEPEEWADLLAGRLGPWAFGIASGGIVAICHTPVGSSGAAEAGVWTHPDARGRGYAATVTAAWARAARQRFDTLFYSTSTENRASQAVARKLGLRPIGGIWQLRRE